MEIRQKPVIARILRIIVGCVFVFSAISKYVSIESFDIYLFEHQLFNYNIGATLSRLLISAEFLIGIFLIADIRKRETYFLTWLMLIGFTIYLLFQPLLFDLSEDDCHCFGNWIHFNRWESIGKNLLLCLILIPARSGKSERKRWHLWAVPSIAAVVTIAFMLINPPDYIFRKIYGDKGKTDTKLYETAIRNSGAEAEFRQGRQLVCFYSPHCKHCKNAATKINLMARFHQWDLTQIRCVFWKSDKSEEEIQAFFQENNLEPLEYTTLPVDTFLNIIDGKLPTVLFSDNGKIVRSINYIQIDEKEMDAFVKGK